MKKTILSILLCGVIVLGLTGCGTKTIIKDKAELNEADGVSMTIEKDTLTRTSATVIISDYGKETNVYGEFYRIDKKENGEWKEVKKAHDDYGFNDMAYFVDEDGKLEFKCDWKYLYGKLENGEYRLVKYTFPNLDRAITDDDISYFSVEFTIE